MRCCKKHEPEKAHDPPNFPGSARYQLSDGHAQGHCQGPREEADLVSTILKEVRQLLSLLHSGDGAAGYPLD